MIDVAATVEYDLFDALLQCTLSNELANSAGAFLVGTGKLKILFNGGSSNEGVACYVVDDLSIDVLFASENTETGSLSGAGDLAANSVVALDALSSGIRSVNHLGAPPFT